MRSDRSGSPGSGYELLLARLDGDPARAGAEFERLRRTLVKFFGWRGAAWPEDCADDTLDRLARKLEEEVAVLDLPGFALGIARMVLHESARSSARLVPLEEADPRAVSPRARPDDSLERHLDRCLEELPQEGRDLVLAYYAAPGGRGKIENRQRLARELRLSDNALRSRVQRLRDRLEQCVRGRAKLASPGSGR